MILAIMQPYLFPYLGYFQLINAVDAFVIYDDVQYIKRGWINRNQILLNNQPHLFTFSITKAPLHFNINQRYFSDDFFAEKKRFLEKIKHAYHDAPYYRETIALLSELLSYPELNVSLLITNSLKKLSAYLNITTTFYLSSELNLDPNLKGEQRIIAINKKMGADSYLNPIGGIELYSGAEFARHGIRLNFLKSKVAKYPQFSQDFVPNLSIIDVLMFNSLNKIQDLLSEFELIHKE